MKVEPAGVLKRPLAIATVAVATVVAVTMPLALTDRHANPAGRRLTPGDYPVVPSAAQPAGAALLNGLTVPAGTVLVGDVFPFREPPRGNPPTSSVRGWRAILVLDGSDPTAVLKALAKQAGKAGLPLFQDRGSKVPICVARTSNGESALDKVTGRKVPLLGVRCTIRHDRASARGATNFTVDLQQGLSRDRKASLSHVVLTYYQWGDAQGRPAQGYQLLLPEAVPRIPTLPVSLPSLAGPGELFGTPLDDIDMQGGLRVPAGSDAAAPAADGNCAQRGFVGVLATTDVTATLRDLERQVVAQGFEVSPQDHWRTQGQTVTVLGSSAAGAGYLNATAVSRGADAYVLIDRCPE